MTWGSLSPEAMQVGKPEIHVYYTAIYRAYSSITIGSGPILLVQTSLGGGFKYGLCSPLLGEDSHFD